MKREYLGEVLAAIIFFVCVLGVPAYLLLKALLRGEL